MGPNLGESSKRLLDASEVDLGFAADVGGFLPSGARLLDDRLINDTLAFLRDPEYRAVLDPSRKGSPIFCTPNKRPEVLPDVIKTDMYEALEAMAKTVTGAIGICPANRRHLSQRLGVRELQAPP